MPFVIDVGQKVYEVVGGRMAPLLKASVSAFFRGGGQELGHALGIIGRIGPIVAFLPSKGRRSRTMSTGYGALFTSGK